MAKPLNREQPTSSVAGMLQPGVGAAVLARTTERPVPVLPVPVAVTPAKGPAEPSGERVEISRQFNLTPSADRTLKRIVSAYSEATGLDLKHSEWLRAVLLCVEHALPELTREAQHIGRLKRPSNERGNEALRDENERRIARAFVAGMRSAGLLD